MTATYKVKAGIYINLTNKCSNDCTFCLRNNGESVYGSPSLWLEREPTADEVIKDFEKYAEDSFSEIVFCGYGEPTEKLDTLLEVAKRLKAKYNKPIRINTNGQASLINGNDTAPLFAGLIDVMSISMNCAYKDEYFRLCKPVYGIDTFEAIIDFGAKCVKYVPEVVFTVVETTLPDNEIEICRKLAESVGAKLRVRPLE